MAGPASSFLDAIQELENEVTVRQKRLIEIRTGQSRYESSVAEEQLLENEIRDRYLAIEKLEQSCCYCCGAQLVRESFFVRLSKYRRLIAINLAMEKVRVRAECADCYKYDLQPRRVVATADEIGRAIEALTPIEMRELQKVADWRVRRVGRAGLGRTGEDLFHDALLSSFTGANNWNKTRVDFGGHLRMAMRKINFRWKQKLEKWSPLLESDLIRHSAEGTEISPLENVPSSEPLASERLIREEKIARQKAQILRKFLKDADATMLLRYLFSGMDKDEILTKESLTNKQYNAIMRRIRVKVFGRNGAPRQACTEQSQRVNRVEVRVECPEARQIMSYRDSQSALCWNINQISLAVSWDWATAIEIWRSHLYSLADSCRSRLFTFLLPFLKPTNEEEKVIYYLAAHADSSRGGIKACDHQHRTIYSATACISAAGGYVVAVENGKERELTDSEEMKFQTAMHGTSEEAQLQTAIQEGFDFTSQNLMNLRRWLAGTFFLAFWQPVWLVFTWRLDFFAYLNFFADHLDHCMHGFIQYAEPIARLKCLACRSKFAKALNEILARLARLVGL
jgi:hypothetical protein